MKCIVLATSKKKTQLLTHSDLNPNADFVPLLLFAGKYLGSVLNRFRITAGSQRPFLKKRKQHLGFQIGGKISSLLFLFVQEQQGLKIGYKMECLTLLRLFERQGYKSGC